MNDKVRIELLSKIKDKNDIDVFCVCYQKTLGHLRGNVISESAPLLGYFGYISMHLPEQISRVFKEKFKTLSYE